MPAMWRLPFSKLGRFLHVLLPKQRQYQDKRYQHARKDQFYTLFEHRYFFTYVVNNSAVNESHIAVYNQVVPQTNRPVNIRAIRGII